MRIVGYMYEKNLTAPDKHDNGSAMTKQVIDYLKHCNLNEKGLNENLEESHTWHEVGWVKPYF